MNSFEEFELTKEQRLYGNIMAGVFTVLCGVFLLLCGLNVFKIQVKDIWLGAVMAAVGLTLFSTGFIQKNTVSVWLSFVFLTPSLVEFLVVGTSLRHSNLYPLYIAIPAIASFVTMIYSRNLKGHFITVLLFGIISIIFSLQSSGLLGWSIVLPLFLLFVGALVIIYSIKSSRSSETKEEAVSENE